MAEIAMNGVRRGQVTWGEEVVVFGLGLVGQLTARFCHLAGARVVGVEPSSMRRDLLPITPRMNTIDPSELNPVTHINSQTHGRMADAAFEVTGAPEAIAKQVAVLRQQGRLVLVSSPRNATSSFDFHDLCNAPNISIIGGP
ncbi:MAG: zinc-binding dehydrogenase [Candidatus Latescibacterota bacterium]|nr:zinc-binding dehydrogenase [Candidatus Latescibacterota bacterium]